jgi:hypothetical protein
MGGQRLVVIVDQIDQRALELRPHIWTDDDFKWAGSGIRAGAFLASSAGMS